MPTRRGAAKEGFDQLDRGEGIEFQSMDELGSYIDQIGEEVSKVKLLNPFSRCQL